jgi:hypothetical protein
LCVGRPQIKDHDSEFGGDGDNQLGRQCQRKYVAPDQKSSNLSPLQVSITFMADRKDSC